MSMKKRYFKTLVKRNISYLPFTLLGSILLCAFVISLAALMFMNLPLSGSSRKYMVGVVRPPKDEYLDWGMSMLMGNDSIGKVFDYKVVKNEKQAYDLFTSDKLDAYVDFSPGWESSIERGTNDTPIKVVVASGQKGISSILIGKSINTLSDILDYTQTAAFSVYDIAKEQGYAHPDKDSDDFILNTLDLSLDRKEMISVININGSGAGYSSLQSFMAGSALFAMLLMSIIFSPIFFRKNLLVQKLSSAKGVWPFSQVMLEYLTYLLHYLFCLTVIILIGNVAVHAVMGIGILHFLPVLYLISFTFTAMQFMFFEISDGVVSGMILQAGVLAGMSYISGYFYLKTMFPKPIMDLGTAFPTGQAMLMLDKYYHYDSLINPYLLSLTAYAVLCLFISVTARSRKLRGSAS